MTWQPVRAAEKEREDESSGVAERRAVDGTEKTRIGMEKKDKSMGRGEADAADEGKMTRRRKRSHCHCRKRNHAAMTAWKQAGR